MPATLLDSGRSVRLTTPDGSQSADVLMYGATVTSWKAGGVERLFLSKASALDGSAPVRGGIPIVFPLFGNLSDHADAPEGLERLPKHGFARGETWTLLQGKEAGEVDEGGRSSVTLALSSATNSTAASTFDWPFELRYTVSLSSPDSKPTLSCTLSVSNVGDSSKPMPFQALLHNYFSVCDVRSIFILGLEGLPYADKVAKTVVDADKNDAVLPGSWPHDRVYKGQSPDVIINGTSLRLTRSQTLKDTVVWNVGEEGAKGLKDLHAGGWREYVCVEPGSVDGFESLKAGQKWEATQHITVI